METAFTRVPYGELSSRQRENFNFHKAASILSEYGYMSIRLSDDWNGADFIALRIDGTSLRIQLKGRLTFDKKYMGKDIWICFPGGSGTIYVYPHDALLATVTAAGAMIGTSSWEDAGSYSFPVLSEANRRTLKLAKGRGAGVCRLSRFGDFPSNFNAL